MTAPRLRPALLASGVLAIALVVMPSRHASATVDAFIPYTVPYQHLQSGDTCLASRVMWAELGIPPASQMEALLAPALVYRQGGGDADINVLSSAAAGMRASYVSDRHDGATVTYEMVLDVSALAAANGASTAGRRATIDAAKLYLISMAASLEQLVPGRWRLALRFVGLPSQTGLAGQRLNARTEWPYSISSVVLLAYRRELVNVGGSCPS